MKQKQYRKRIFGISLLELVLALTVITTLITLALRYYPVATSAKNVNDAVKMADMVISAAENWQLTYGDYGNDTTCITGTQSLIDRGWLPTDFATASANPWGGNITVVSRNAEGGCTKAVDSTRITVTLSKLPQNACTMINNFLQQKNFCPAVPTTNPCPTQTNNTYKSYYPATASGGCPT